MLGRSRRLVTLAWRVVFAYQGSVDVAGGGGDVAGAVLGRFWLLG